MSEGYEVPTELPGSTGLYAYVYVWSSHIRKGEDQPDKVVNPNRGQLIRENIFSLSPFAPENLVSRDGFGSPVPRQPAHLHTNAKSGAYVIPPEFRGDLHD